MSDYSAVFDQLADALKASGASPSTTLRLNRPARRHAHLGQTQTFASRPIPCAPTPLDPTIDLDLDLEPELLISAKTARKRRDVDRSRDHAVYAAPHRPMRPHAHSRPDDISTERILRRAIRTASKAHLSLPIVIIAFGATVIFGLGLVLLLFR